VGSHAKIFDFSPMAISNITTELGVENLVLSWTVNIITYCTGEISFKSKVTIMATMKTLWLYMATLILVM